MVNIYVLCLCDPGGGTLVFEKYSQHFTNVKWCLRGLSCCREMECFCFVFSLTKLESNIEKSLQIRGPAFSVFVVARNISLRVSKSIFSSEFFVSNLSDNFY